MKKPSLPFWQIWNISFGFLGIQIGYSLQISNTSRILSSFGVPDHLLSACWMVAPLAGLLVQPIVGMSSDRIWTKLGRRIPFILGGSIFASIALFFMPNAHIVASLLSPIIFVVFMLLFMDCSFNVTMQPFRALVGDMVNEEQKNIGYSTQSFLTTIGGVVGSALPAILVLVGISNVSSTGGVAPTVIWAFYIGGILMIATVLWTAYKVKEYPPKEHAAYNGIKEDNSKQKSSFLTTLKNTPPIMFQVGVVQFFSWFALFIMWVYAPKGIANNVWHTLVEDSSSTAYNDAANWNGVLNGFYGIFGAIFSIFMAKLATKFGRKQIYSFSLLAGAIGLISMYYVQDKYLLIISMLGVGIAWAGILAMPYTIISGYLPANKMGVYMGIFNATITIPQIAAALLGGFLLKYCTGGSNVGMFIVSGVTMAIAGLCVPLVIKSNHKKDLV